MKKRKTIVYTVPEYEIDSDFYIIGINSYIKDHILAAVLQSHLNCKFQLYQGETTEEEPYLPFSKEDKEHAIYTALKSGKQLAFVQNNNIFGKSLFPSLKVFDYLLIIDLPSTYTLKIQEILETIPEIFFSSILPKEQINKESNLLADQLINQF